MKRKKNTKYRDEFTCAVQLHFVQCKNNQSVSDVLNKGISKAIEFWNSGFAILVKVEHGNGFCDTDFN